MLQARSWVSSKNLALARGKRAATFGAKAWVALGNIKTVCMPKSKATSAAEGDKDAASSTQRREARHDGEVD